MRAALDAVAKEKEKQTVENESVKHNYHCC